MTAGSSVYSRDDIFLLEDAVRILQVTAGRTVPADLLPNLDKDSDNRLGVAEAIYIIRNIAEQ